MLINLGPAKKEAGPAVWRIVEIELPDKDQPVVPTLTPTAQRNQLLTTGRGRQSRNSG